MSRRQTHSRTNQCTQSVVASSPVEHDRCPSRPFPFAIPLRQGSNATIMTEADLTDEVLNQLNAYTRKAGLTAADFYVNEKIPFGFNYVDADTDITHDNDTQGDHGSHVTGIAAGNRFVRLPAEGIPPDRGRNGRLSRRSRARIDDGAADRQEKGR